MKKIFNILIVLATLMLSACHYEIDDVFDQSSAVRVQEEMKRVNDILKGAGNGWVMEYYAASKYGGYNVICKFNEDNTVLAQSEIYGPATAESHYKFEQSQGVVLSFDEYNEIIHFFSNPANPAGLGDDGDGMLGDFEFRVASAAEDLVVLSGKKHGSRIVMRPMAEGADWTEYFEDVLTVEEAIFSNGYVMTFGNSTVVANCSYRQMSFMNPETSVAVNVPFIITNNGIRLYRDLTYAGKTVNEYVYSAEEGKLVAVNDNTVSIEKRIPPLSEVIESNLWFFSEENMSPVILPYYQYANELCKAHSQIKGPIIYMCLGNAADLAGPDADAGWGFVSYVGIGFLGTINFDLTAVDDDTISLAYTKADGNGGAFINVVGFSNLVSIMQSTFDLSTDNLKNPSWIKMTDTENPDIYMYLYAADKPYPFGQ